MTLRSFRAALTLSLASLSGAAVADTTLLYNVNGWTATASAADTGATVQEQRFSALLVHEGRVVSAGTFDDLRTLAARLGEPVTRIDGEGAFLMPGLIDAHGHFTSLGYDALRLNITGLQSLKATVDAIARYAETGDGWITGGRWNQEHWPEGRFPRASDLDGITDRPIWLRRVDGHAAWANGAAMAAAGISADTLDPPGGQLIRDENGTPTGVFVDAAMDLIDAVVPRPSQAQLEQAIGAAQDIILSKGLTQVHDAGAGVRTIETLQRLAKAGDLKVRLYVMVAGEETLEALGTPQDDPEDRVDVQAVKLYSDGALGSRGAALFEDYNDDEGNRGLLFTSAEDLARIVDQATGRGWQVGIHAIGTRANAVVLDAYEQAFQRYPGSKDLRHRIEHAQVMRPGDLQRTIDLGVVASMQPTHATSDMWMAEKRLGSERLAGGYAWATLLKNGAVLALGSDFPVEPPDPVFGIHAAVTRQNRQDDPPGGWRPSEKLTLSQTLRGFTLDAAWSARQESQLGSLEPTKWADFVILEEDPFTVAPEDLWKLQVKETWIAGERVYAKTP